MRKLNGKLKRRGPSFPPLIVQRRFYRQGKRCAICRKALIRDNRSRGMPGAYHGHHIDGDADNNVLSNCAVVCIPCHRVAHPGGFNSGWLRLKRDFRLTTARRKSDK